MPNGKALMMSEALIGKIALWFFVSILAGLLCASYQYPFFIEGHSGSWKLNTPITIEANLLVVASLLIGVAVVQGQNLNRLLDIRRNMPHEKKLPGTNAAKVYDYLRTGFWLLSIDVLIVLGILVLAIFFREGLSNGQAYILASLWWSTITLIVAGWISLAIVAGCSYRDE